MQWPPGQVSPDKAWLADKEGPTRRRVSLGDVAQLVEHLLCTQGVVGSSPIVSTRSRVPGLVTSSEPSTGALGCGGSGPERGASRPRALAPARSVVAAPRDRALRRGVVP